MCKIKPHPAIKQLLDDAVITMNLLIAIIPYGPGYHLAQATSHLLRAINSLIRHDMLTSCVPDSHPRGGPRGPESKITRSDPEEPA